MGPYYQSPYFHFERRLLTRMRRIGRAPKVVYDIGASNGIWSDLAARCLPDASYHLFEPLASHETSYAEAYAKKLARRPSWTLHEVAIGDTTGAAEFAKFPNAVGSTLLPIAPENTSVQRLNVPAVRLDDYVAEKSLALPDFVKMDTQGGERAIIRGGQSTLAHAGMLLVETWLTRGYGAATPLFHEIMEELQPLGFTLTDMTDAYYTPHHRLASVDALFVREAILNDLKDAEREVLWGKPFKIGLRLKLMAWRHKYF
jgi:FkbM family methyltransferase